MINVEGETVIGVPSIASDMRRRHVVEILLGILYQVYELSFGVIEDIV
jgi:hypothetical protein